MDEALNENFLIELFKLCLKKEDILNVCIKHLKYQYLPSTEYKEVWKQIYNEYTFTKTIPTLGILFQNLKDKEKSLKVLEKIRDVEYPNEDSTIKVLEEFIKNSICINFYDSFQEIYSQGNREKARQFLYETSNKLHDFSLKSEYCFSTIFQGFQERQYQKKIDNAIKNEDFGFIQPVVGIDEIDMLYVLKNGSIVMSIAQSGVGKTTQLIYTAVTNAQRGLKVLYVTSEGTIEEINDRIDSCWSAYKKDIIEKGDLSDEDIEKLNKVAEQVVSMGGEIESYVFKKFGIATITDVYNLVEEYEKKHGQVPDVLILDYLELFTVADQHFKDEKLRMTATCRALQNLILSKGIYCSFTATQTSNIPSELINSEEFVITREHIKSDKNLIDAVSLCFSINQTISEANSNIIRIWIEKSRHSSKNTKQLFRIYTDYEHGRFYNRKKSLDNFCTTLI